MRQVVVIHGGDSFPTYDAYLANLRDKTIDLDRYRPHPDWKTHLPEALGAEYDILMPRMPNATNARYTEWALLFGKIAPLLDEEVILVGHSLGAVFLARYLSEHRFPVRIAATFLLAAPYDAAGDLSEEFTAPASLDLLAKQGGKIFLYHSEDDLVVPFAELAKYQAALPSATACTFSDRGHFFGQSSFPELVADIKNLS